MASREPGLRRTSTLPHPCSSRAQLRLCLLSRPAASRMASATTLFSSRLLHQGRKWASVDWNRIRNIFSGDRTMNTTRRRFLTSALSSGAVAAGLPSAAGAQFLNAPRHGLPGTLKERYAKCDEILQQPVFKRELFKDPVIIQSVELLTRDKQYICRVRSKDGHEGIAVSNAQQMEVLYPIFTKRIAPFFIGKDARDIEQLIPAS